ncbi:hypothetical protein SESBI_06444 [Sesbania bispinosa]|nr:hypothetical protein SESBI_06444 [Sesbania bispinosa]
MSTEPSTELSPEEQDLLARSTKKPKVGPEMEEGGGEEPPVDEELANRSDETKDDDHDMELFEIATGVALKRTSISYKDAQGVNGGYRSDPASESKYEPSFEGGESSKEEGDESEVEEDRLCPVIKLSKEERHEVCKPWRKALIVKLLGKRVGLKFLHLRLLKLRQPVGEMEVIDLENDYFFIRLSDVCNVAHALGGGPWIISGHYLVMQRWQPEFNPFTDELKRVAVWIRIPGLPIEYYDRHVLWRIGGAASSSLEKPQPAPAANSKQDSGLAGNGSAEKGQTGEDAFGSWMLVGRQKHRQRMARHDCGDENQVEQEQNNLVSSSKKVKTDVIKEGPQVNDVQIGQTSTDTIEENNNQEKVVGPKSFRKAKVSARGKNTKIGPVVGSIKNPYVNEKRGPDMNLRPLASGSENKENIGPDPVLSLRPVYKSVLRDSGRPPEGGIAKLEGQEAIENGTLIKQSLHGDNSKGQFEAHAHSLGH